MQKRRHLGGASALLNPVVIAALVGAPLAFVLGAWWYGGGLPYFKDANETYLSYVHGRNLVIANPWRFAFLTAEDTPPPATGAKTIYSHNPNGPRYAHATLYLIGIRSLAYQVLATTIAASLLHSWGMVRLAGVGTRFAPFWWALPVLFLSDLAASLTHLGNTYRVWCLVLFWGLLAAATTTRRIWPSGVAAFVICQVEIGTALAFGVTAVTYLWLACAERRRAKSVAMAVGAALSVGLFGAQVLVYYGLSGLMTELTSTYLRRGTAATGLWETFRTTVDYLNGVYYGPHIWWGIGYGLFSALMVRLALATRRAKHLWGDLLPSRIVAANIVLAVFVGAAVTVLTLRGYFEDGFIRTYFPFLGFGIAASWASMALDGAALLRSLKLRAIAWIPLAMVLAFVVQSSHNQYRAYPPLTGGAMQALAEPTLTGQAFVAPVNFHVLAHAVTGGRASLVNPLPEHEQLKNSAAALQADHLYYLCIDRPWAGMNCRSIRNEFEGRGYEIVYSGTDYFIAEVLR